MRQKSVFCVLLILFNAFFQSIVVAQNFASLENQAAISFGKGLELLTAKRYAEAAKEFETTITLEPSNAKAHNALGTVNVYLNRRSEAYQNFREAIRLDPKFANAFYNLGRLSDLDGQPKIAADNFRQAVECRPDYLPGWVALGISLIDLKNYNEAVTALETAAKIDSQQHNIFVYLGYVYDLIGKKQEAIESYRRAAILNPKGFTARNNLAVSLYENNRFEEALAEYKTLIQNFPDSREAHYNLGILYLAMKDKKAAAQQALMLKRFGSPLEKELLDLMFADKIVRIK